MPKITLHVLVFFLKDPMLLPSSLDTSFKLALIVLVSYDLKIIQRLV